MRDVVDLTAAAHRSVDVVVVAVALGLLVLVVAGLVLIRRREARDRRLPSRWDEERRRRQRTWTG